MKTEVYSWRLSSDLKATLAREAHRRGESVSAILDQAATAWLQTASGEPDDQQQAALHQAASKCVGVFASGKSNGSTTVRQTVRDRLARKHGR